MLGSDEVRVVLVKPGDLLLIGNVEITAENADMVRDAFREINLHAVVFAGDIELDKLTPEQMHAALRMRQATTTSNDEGTSA